MLGDRGVISPFFGSDPSRPHILNARGVHTHADGRQEQAKQLIHPDLLSLAKCAKVF